ncbi:rRNA adenine N-6-methyltransferase family protein [Amycolatopsis sp. NPDC051903]|uniref:rRNA adenine N-6-methyltransferase family protein n=1 Tax=Amycolatopsis sp. NPDC051903 TaxID=3363936 RepID=UPI00379A3797
MSREELHSIADAAMDQYFLVSPEKLSKIYDAAAITAEDRVVEVGAGAGTVSHEMPPTKSLTVVELDDRLLDLLRRHAPANAKLIHGDALHVIRDLQFDVLIANLPNTITEELLPILPDLDFRTAVLAVGEHTDVSKLGRQFDVSEVTTISGDDFAPPQPSVSRIVKVASRGHRDNASTA